VESHTNMVFVTVPAERVGGAREHLKKHNVLGSARACAS